MTAPKAQCRSFLGQAAWSAALNGLRDEVEDGGRAGVVDGATVPVVPAVVLRQHVVIVLHAVVGAAGGAEREGGRERVNRGGVYKRLFR